MERGNLSYQGPPPAPSSLMARWRLACSKTSGKRGRGRHASPDRWEVRLSLGSGHVLSSFVMRGGGPPEQASGSVRKEEASRQVTAAPTVPGKTCERSPVPASEDAAAEDHTRVLQQQEQILSRSWRPGVQTLRQQGHPPSGGCGGALPTASSSRGWHSLACGPITAVSAPSSHSLLPACPCPSVQSSLLL